MKLLTHALFSLAILASACSGGGSKDECDPADYPVCEGINSISCEGGREVPTSCGAGELCGLSSAGDATVCVPDGEAVCDPASYEGECTDDGGIRSCAASGVTELTDCADGTSCQIGEDGPVCITDGEMVCPPDDSFQPRCDGDSVVVCEGSATVTTSCAPDTCREASSIGPVCAPADAEPCEFSGTQCFSGHVQECVEGFAYPVTTCGATDICIIDECFADDIRTCTYSSKPRCDGGTRSECDATYGVYRDAPCAAGATCALDPLAGAVCIESTEVVCDPAVDAPSCVDGSTARRCIESAGMTLTTTCDAGESCQTTDTGAWCVPDGAAACDPETYESECNGSTATTCDIQKHVVVSIDCPSGSICLDDDFGNLYKFAGCFDEGLADCTEPAHQGCTNETTRQWCVGGKLVQRPCEDGEVCYGGGLRAECRPANANPCSVFDFADTCEGPSALRECFAGFEIVTRCDRVGGRCDPGAAACDY